MFRKVIAFMNVLVFTSLSLFANSVAGDAQVIQEDIISVAPSLFEEPRTPGLTEGKGRSFEVKDSDYLNVKLESSEEVLLSLESVPRMITLDIKAAEGAPSTLITLSGLAPLTTYYKYEDDYHNLEMFTTDPNGNFTYLQDLTGSHLVMIQENPSTKFIPTDTSIGVWDPINRIYRLTTNVYETIQFDQNNLTLDGAGFSIIGTGTGNGIYINQKSGITVRNLNVRAFSYAIYIASFSGQNTVSNVIASYSYDGIILAYSSNNRIENCRVYGNKRYGINLYSANSNSVIDCEAHSNDESGIMLTGSFNVLTSNNVHNNGLGPSSRFGIWMMSGTQNIFRNNTLSQNRNNFFIEAAWNQDIDTTNLVEGKPILHLINPVDLVLENTDAYGAIFIAQGENVRLSNLAFANNNFANINFFETNQSQIENMNYSGGSQYEIYARSCSNNTFSNNYFYGTCYVMNIFSGSQNTIANNHFQNDMASIQLSGSSDNIIQNNSFYTSNNSNGSSIAVYNSERNTICDNMFSGAGAGRDQSIYITSGTANKIERNRINGVYVGICIDWGGSNIVSENDVSGCNTVGMTIGDTANNIIKNNELYNNRLLGAILIQTHNEIAVVEGNLIEKNHIYNNQSGFNTWGMGTVKNNTLIENNIHNNYSYGIAFNRNGLTNKVIKNTVSNNGYGIYVGWLCNNNQIYNNNFTNNSAQALVSGGSGNIFNLDKPTGGNYWSNWTGPDNDRDGFVDSPYVFAGGVDNLPLAHPYSANKPPFANAGPDQTPAVGEVVLFNGGGSSDPDGTIVSYYWDFGDGQTESGIMVNHSYAAKGTYTVTLTVTDDKGATATDTLIVSVTNTPPVAEAGPDLQLPKTQPGQFDGRLSSDPDGTIVRYLWDFGDGTSADGPMPTHAYAEWGTYPVTLTVTDNEGATATDTMMAIVTNYPPEAKAGNDQTIEGTGPTTSFILDGSGSSDPDGETLTYIWSDANGVVGNGQQLTLSRVVGSHSFTLKVVDHEGLDSTDNIVVTIQDTTPPTITAPANTTKDQSDPYGTPVSLGQPTVSDICDQSLTLVNNAPALFPVGETMVTWTATDDSGNKATAQQKVTIVYGSPDNQLNNLTLLIEYSVAAGTIAPELEEPLLAKVAAARAAIARANASAATAAMNDLNALINQVEAQADKKITPEIADQITAWANQIIAELGG